MVHLEAANKPKRSTSRLRLPSQLSKTVKRFTPTRNSMSGLWVIHCMKQLRSSQSILKSVVSQFAEAVVMLRDEVLAGEQPNAAASKVVDNYASDVIMLNWLCQASDADIHTFLKNIQDYLVAFSHEMEAEELRTNELVRADSGAVHAERAATHMHEVLEILGLRQRAHWRPIVQRGICPIRFAVLGRNCFLASSRAKHPMLLILSKTTQSRGSVSISATDIDNLMISLAEMISEQAQALNVQLSQILADCFHAVPGSTLLQDSRFLNGRRLMLYIRDISAEAHWLLHQISASCMPTTSPPTTALTMVMDNLYNFELQIVRAQLGESLLIWQREVIPTDRSTLDMRQQDPHAPFHVAKHEQHRPLDQVTRVSHASLGLSGPTNVLKTATVDSTLDEAIGCKDHGFYDTSPSGRQFPICALRMWGTSSSVPFVGSDDRKNSIMAAFSHRNQRKNQVSHPIGSSNMRNNNSQIRDAETNVKDAVPNW
ncbi:hypothetical protein BC832DRAFT_610320 [Gaertneriomyces semiglobifer]|nr:hypothetical protein BC832DRAFT_610320 [Gaertneriomyces semiglobifer]